MNRDALLSASSQDGCICARAAPAEREAGADFAVFLNRTVSAQQLRDIRSLRQEIVIETGVTPRPGLAEALAGLRAEGAERVRMATVTGSQRRFTILLSEDLTRRVASS